MTFARRAHALFVAFVVVTVAVTPFVLRAQSAAPKPIALEDYPKFKRITGTAISTDGKWMLYTVTPNEGDATLFVKALDGDNDLRRAAGGERVLLGQRAMGRLLHRAAGGHGPGRPRRRPRRTTPAPAAGAAATPRPLRPAGSNCSTSRTARRPRFHRWGVSRSLPTASGC